jgi:hypothetical protein
MPKKKIEEIVGKLKTNRPESRTGAARLPATVKAVKPRSGNGSKTTAVADISQFPAAFENKAGHYELIRVDDGQAYYSFTNHQQKTVDAAMPVLTWRKMLERALAALKESA